MRRPAIQKSQRGRSRVIPISVPAPFGGINATAGLAGGMPATDAIDLINWIPIEGGLETRPGYRVGVDLGTGAPAPFLRRFDGLERTSVAASGGKLFLLTGSPLSATEIGTGYASDHWQGAVLGGRLHLTNGVDSPQAVYDGMAEAAAWAGPDDLAKLHSVRAYASRLFFAEKGSSAFWYSGLQFVQGELSRFDLSGVTSRGGTIEHIATITPDGGRDGDDDSIVFFMSSGDAVVYRGTSPDDAQNWARVGTFTAARPIATDTYGADVLMASLDGYAELSRLLPSGRSPVAGFGDKIGPLARTTVSRFGAQRGWQIIYDPARRLILVHVPQTTTIAEQHVMNAATGSWARWQDLPAAGWGMVGDDLAFGSFDGHVGVMGGAMDGSSPIVAKAQGSWQQFGYPGNKKVNAVKPVVSTAGTPAVSHVLAADFEAPFFASATDVPAERDVGAWDQAVWDQAVWAGRERVNNDLRGGGLTGNFLAMGLRADTVNAPLKWISSTLMVERGGVR